MTIRSEIKTFLQEHAEEGYRDFTSRLTPGISARTICGVRLPVLRAYAKTLYPRDDVQEFLQDLPHASLEENLIHAFLLCERKDYEDCIQGVREFIPYADCWNVTDSLSPKVFRRHPYELRKEIEQWLQSDHPFTVRYAVFCMMRFELKEGFQEEDVRTVVSMRTDHYYVNMMRAWYLAEAMITRYETVVPYLKDLDAFTYRMTVNKARDSFRIPEEHKMELKRGDYRNGKENAG